ncbi:MAG TPA: response regulator [Pirellulales bacterium]|jgi:DNA-binding response OmpR family regulator|nr:response regulator [Pirellulales bacterium]
MTLSLRFHSQIVVADARPHDYQELTQLATKHGWQVHLLTSATAVLRLTPSKPVDLYLVNTRLPDISGFDLFEMLRDRIPTARVFIVSDTYDDDDERQACCCGAALYLCKGPNHTVEFGAFLDFLVDQPAPLVTAEPIVVLPSGVDSLSHPRRVSSTADIPWGGQTH